MSSWYLGSDAVPQADLGGGSVWNAGGVRCHHSGKYSHGDHHNINVGCLNKWTNWGKVKFLCGKTANVVSINKLDNNQLTF